MLTKEEVKKPQTTLQRWMKRLPVLLLLGFLLFRFVQTRNSRAPQHIDMATLQLRLLNGAPVPANAIQGKAIVLNFWAPWCPPCRIEIPWLQQLQAAHPKDVLVVGVVADSEQYVQARLFMSSRGMTYLLVQDSTTLDKTFGAIEGLPTTFYINPQGKVLHTAFGLVPESVMQRYVADLVKQ